MLIFQYGLYLWVLLPRIGKEGQRGKLQVIRGSPCGKNFLPEVPCISYGAIYSRRGSQHTPTRIFNFRQTVPGRDIWDSSWTGEITQECQEPTPSRNPLRPLRKNAKSWTHATGVILRLHDEASNSYRCGDQNSVVPRVIRGKHPLPSSRPDKTDFWQLVLGMYNRDGQVGFFHCGQDRRNYMGHDP